MQKSLRTTALSNGAYPFQLVTPKEKVFMIL